MFQFKTLQIEDILENKHFDVGDLFTRKQWLKFVAELSGAKIVAVEICSNQQVVGYLTGLIFSVFGLRIFGSPFRGWSSCYMGFRVPPEIMTSTLISETLHYLHNDLACVYVEIIDCRLPKSACEGLGLALEEIQSIEVDLTQNKEAIFARFKTDGRNFIRQFERKGSKVIRVEPSDEFADEFYEQLINVFARQGTKPTYSAGKVRSICKHLKNSDSILCLKAFGPEGNCIASSIFIADETRAFFWGGASLREFQGYRPNEGMIWYAINHWKDQGRNVLDLVGIREYKLKFSPRKVTFLSLISSKYKVLITLKNIAEKLFFLKLKVSSIFQSKPSNAASPSSFRIQQVINQEIVHYADNSRQIMSRFRNVSIFENGGLVKLIKLPIGPLILAIGQLRLIRRFLRVDKSCVIQTKTGIVIFWQGAVYHYPNSDEPGTLTMKMNGCRTPLHGSIANVDGRTLFFGEYGRPYPSGKTVYKSTNGGMKWQPVFNFSCEQIRHIHSCKWDPYEQKLWVFTGDFNGQCKILCADQDFKSIEWIGDGSQFYRVVDAIFEKDEVHWVMDSPISPVHHIALDRKTRKISVRQQFDGPVWYMKKLSDGYILVCTTQEVGPSHRDKKVHLMATRDYKKWVDVTQFQHDGWPKGFFKFGVGAFADGSQDSKKFYMHFEAIKGLDGKSAVCGLNL